MSDASAKTPGIRLLMEGGVAWITFDNPDRLNALNAQMWGELPQVMTEVEADGDTRVVVLRGAGEKAFSAGADISEFATARSGAAAETYNRLNHEAFMALQACKVPSIAMVHGFCLGGGLALAMSCDLRVCDDRATFSIPAARLGIGYHPRWLRPILAAVSAPHAKELLFTGKRFDTRWALRSGLVNDVVAHADLDAHVRSLASGICANAPLTIEAAKHCIDTLSADTGSEKFAELEKLVGACFDSEDYEEGQRAFMEKRAPKFKGR